LPILCLDYNGIYRDRFVPIGCISSYERCNPVSYEYDIAAGVEPMPPWVDFMYHAENNAENWDEPDEYGNVTDQGPEVSCYPFPQHNAVYAKVAKDFDDEDEDGMKEEGEPEFWVIEYWYYYVYNSPCNNMSWYHEHDWEWVYVILDESGTVPLYALISAHDLNGWVDFYNGRLYRVGEEITVKEGTDRVVVQVYPGTHAMDPILDLSSADWLYPQLDFDFMYPDPCGTDTFYFDESWWKSNPDGYTFRNRDVRGDGRAAPWLRTYMGINSFYGYDEVDINGVPGDPLPPEFHLPSDQNPAMFLSMWNGFLKDGIVTINWTSEWEEGCAGYHIHRSVADTSNFVRITGELIPPLDTGDWNGGDYSYEDVMADPETMYFYKVEMVFEDGTSEFSGVIEVCFDAGRSPRKVLSVCPNPFNPTVEIEFEVERVCHVNLSIYDTEGRLVTTLLNRTLLPGAHRRVWAGTSSGGEPVSSGVYFCKLTLEGAETTSKLVCIR
jgi:hypothetical protein